MANLFMVTVRFVSTPLNPALIDAVVSMKADWIRFNLETWFVASNSSPTELRMLLHKHLLPEDNFLILPIDPLHADGWAPSWVWEWFSRHRNNLTPLPPPPPPGPPPPGIGLGIRFPSS
jgi:hypothetical protein